MQLSGELGADWHSAYLLVYSSKQLPKGEYASLKPAATMEVDGAAAAPSAPMDE
eukprot:m.314668 g.314668  ORF g.314668 m.314668 type:complete len:54 (+) comp27505_c2_seq2:932-1093(+)